MREGGGGRRGRERERETIGNMSAKTSGRIRRYIGGDGERERKRGETRQRKGNRRRIKEGSRKKEGAGATRTRGGGEEKEGERAREREITW